MADGPDAAQELHPAEGSGAAAGATGYGKFHENEAGDGKRPAPQSGEEPASMKTIYVALNLFQAGVGITLHIGAAAGVHAIVESTSQLENLKSAVDDYAILLHVIVVVIIICTALPCGTGFELTRLFSGYVLGWPALISCTIGLVVGSTVVSCIGRRPEFRGFVDKQIADLRPGQKAVVNAALKVNGAWELFCLFLAFQSCYLMTFGLSNSVLAFVTSNCLVYTTFNVLATAPNGIGFIGIGTCIRKLGSYIKDDHLDTNTSIFVTEVALIVMAMLAWLGAFLSSLFFLSKKVQEVDK